MYYIQRSSWAIKLRFELRFIQYGCRQLAVIFGLWSAGAVQLGFCLVNCSSGIQILLACRFLVAICAEIIVWSCLLFDIDITKLCKEFLNLIITILTRFAIYDKITFNRYLDLGHVFMIWTEIINRNHETTVYDMVEGNQKNGPLMSTIINLDTIKTEKYTDKWKVEKCTPKYPLLSACRNGSYSSVLHFLRFSVNITYKQIE